LTIRPQGIIFNDIIPPAQRGDKKQSYQDHIREKGGEKHMKKLIIAVIAIFLVVSVYAAKAPSKAAPKAKATVVVPTPEPTPVPTATPTFFGKIKNSIKSMLGRK
jgi:hypothetical protein